MKTAGKSLKEHQQDLEKLEDRLSRAKPGDKAGIQKQIDNVKDIIKSRQGMLETIAEVATEVEKRGNGTLAVKLDQLAAGIEHRADESFQFTVEKPAQIERGRPWGSTYVWQGSVGGEKALAVWRTSADRKQEHLPQPGHTMTIQGYKRPLNFGMRSMFGTSFAYMIEIDHWR